MEAMSPNIQSHSEADNLGILYQNLLTRYTSSSQPCSIPAYSIPSKIKLPTSCSLQGPGVKFSLQGVRIGPLVKSARSSIWPMDRSGSILKGKGSKGSRTYRSVVPLGSDLLGRGAITAQRRRRSR